MLALQLVCFEILMGESDQMACWNLTDAGIWVMGATKAHGQLTANKRVVGVDGSALVPPAVL